MTKDQVRSTEEALDLALEALKNVTVTGPDDDGLVWINLPGNGTTGKAILRVGKAGLIAAQCAKLYEEQRTKAITAIKQARSAPYVASPRVQEPVAVYGYCPICGAEGVMRERRPNGYDKCAKGHTYPSSKATPPGGRQSEDCLTAAQEDIQRLSALVRAQQITIDKLEQARSAPVQVSPLEFVTMVMEKEHLVGKPLFWAEWPNKENT